MIAESNEADDFVSSASLITSSTMGTTNFFLDAKKIAARVVFSEELNEDSITPILPLVTVFIAGVEEEILPHRKTADSAESVEEERRLFYVGITRAMEELYFTHAGHMIKYGEKLSSPPSWFIDEIDGGVLQRIDGTEKSDPADEKHFARESMSRIKAILGE